MPKKDEVEKRKMLRNSKSPIEKIEQTEDSDRRSFLKKSIAAVTGLVGVPVIGASNSKASSGSGEIIEEFSRPDVVQQVIYENQEMFETLNEIGVLEDVHSEGLQVSAVGSEELVPELRLFIGTQFGKASVVMTPYGENPHTYFVSNVEDGDPVPFPADKGNEIPFGRVVHEITPDGFRKPGFKNADVIEDGKVEDIVDRYCKDPLETLCGPTGGGCNPPGYIDCCGRVVRKPGCSDDDDDSSELFEPTCPDPEDELCYKDGFFCKCIEL